MKPSEIFETPKASGFAEAMRNRTEAKMLDVAKEATKMQVEALNTHQQPSIREQVYSLPENVDGDVVLTKSELLNLLTSHSQVIRERVLAVAPGFQSTKTGDVTYDAGVQEYMARIEALFNDSEV